MLKNFNPTFSQNAISTIKQPFQETDKINKKESENRIDEVIPLSTIIDFGKNRFVKDGISISSKKTK